VIYTLVNYNIDKIEGNLIIRIENNNPKLIVLDAGLVSELNETDKINFFDLFSAVVEGNGELVAELMITRSKNYDKLKLNPENIMNFKKEMKILVNNCIDKPLKEMEAGKILSSVLDMGKKYQVLIESNFTTLGFFFNNFSDWDCCY
jgi:aarF domain-containing kinase